MVDSEFFKIKFTFLLLYNYLYNNLHRYVMRLIKHVSLLNTISAFTLVRGQDFGYEGSKGKPFVKLK